jgi:hypothetical protein
MLQITHLAGQQAAAQGKHEAVQSGWLACKALSS